MAQYQLSSDIIAERLLRLRLKMAQHDLDGLLISNPFNRRYFSGFTADDHALNESSGYLFVTAQGNPRGDSSDGKAVMIVNLLFEGQAKQDTPQDLIDTVSYYSTGRTLESVFVSIIRQHRLRRIGFESDFLTYYSYNVLRKAVEAAVEDSPSRKPELAGTRGFADGLRAVKTEDEIAAIQHAIDISDRAYEYILTYIKPGMTESQVAWEIDKFVREHGAEGPSFPTNVSAGVTSAIPHYVTGNRVIREGEPILIDMGCRVDGYISDITRTFCLGEPDDTFKKVYPIVLQANRAAAKAARAGITGKELDAAARDVIDASEYKGKLIHSLGHGIGLAVHEAPGASMRSEGKLEAGMLVTNEPGIYIEGWGGVRIEDVLLIEDGGSRVLTRASKYMDV